MSDFPQDSFAIPGMMPILEAAPVKQVTATPSGGLTTVLVRLGSSDPQPPVDVVIETMEGKVLFQDSTGLYISPRSVPNGIVLELHFDGIRVCMSPGVYKLRWLVGMLEDYTIVTVPNSPFNPLARRCTDETGYIQEAPSRALD